jgi:phosphomannomutase
MSKTDETRKTFGTDGIRGVANQYPMTAEIALALGRAVAERFGRGGRRCRVVIGKDTRLSGYMIESALEAGIVSAGADVMLVGPLPTPAIAFITSSMRADAGVVISASHNPYQDNGIKIFASDGFKLPDDVEADIERRMTDPEAAHARPRAQDRQGHPHRRCGGALRAVPQAQLPQGAHPRRCARGGRLCQRRGLSGGAASLHRAGGRGDRAVRRTERAQHQ